MNLYELYTEYKPLVRILIYAIVFWFIIKLFSQNILKFLGWMTTEIKDLVGRKPSAGATNIICLIVVSASGLLLIFAAPAGEILAALAESIGISGLSRASIGIDGLSFFLILGIFAIISIASVALVAIFTSRD